MSLGWPQAVRCDKYQFDPATGWRIQSFLSGCLEMQEQNDMAVGDRIKAKLQAALTPSSIEVIDESHKHATHAHAMKRHGTAGSAGGTHFRIKVVSEIFRGKSRVDRHRAINHLLKTEFETGMHALAIEAKAPGE